MISFLFIIQVLEKNVNGYAFLVKRFPVTPKGLSKNRFIAYSDFKTRAVIRLELSRHKSRQRNKRSWKLWQGMERTSISAKMGDMKDDM